MPWDVALDRRTAVVGLLGAAGAGGAISVSQSQRQPAATRRVSAAQPVRMESAGIGKVAIAPVPIGAGGFVTGIEISSDGTRRACRTDVANAYVRDDGDAFWRPLFSPLTMAPQDLDPPLDRKDKADAWGVAGIRIAPSDKNVIFATYVGFVWKSIDGGTTVRRTRLPQKRFNTNAGVQRLHNPTIDIDPRNPSAVIVGTWGEGAWFTTDGGDTWGQAPLPQAGTSHDGQPGLHLVLFDPAATNRVYVFVTGVGLFKSEAGPGGAFAPLPGGPRHCSTMAAGADGSIYLCEQTKDYQGGQVWRYVPTRGWTSAKPEREAQVIALDPRRPNRAILIESNGFFMKSEDGCASFTGIGRGKWVDKGGEIEWMGGLDTIFPAQCRFDPRSPDRLWIAQGVGVASADVGRTTPPIEDWSAGIEELCAVSALCVPGGKTFLSAWDKPFWRVDSLSSYTNSFRYPVVEGSRYTPSLVAFSSYLDFAPEDTRFVVGVTAPVQGSAPGFTDNGGDSWRAFSGTPASGWGFGGCIAAASKSNFVLLPSNNGTGVFTLDGGKSWAPIKLDGTNPTGGFANAYYVPRKNVTADKSRPGTFALVYTTIKANEYAEPLGGLWVTRDGGRTWTQQLAGVIGPPGATRPSDVLAQGLDARQFWSCQLEYVPGRSGELLYTPHADFAADRFYWSGDDGRSWKELHRSIRNVRAFGFGKAAPGQDRPVVFFWGEVGGRRGLYATLDWFASEPRLVTRFPSLISSEVSCIGGDLNVFGRCFVGTSCAGWIRIEIQR